MPLKFIVCLAAFMVASSLPAPDQVSIPDQNMKQDGETVVHSGLESYVHHPRLVRNSDTNTKSGGAGGVNYGLRVGENTVVKDGIVSTSLELPSINAMDNDIIINQNRNRIFGNSKLVVNQIDNEIFGNSEIEVNQQDNTIGGKSPILMNVDGNNIVGNSSVDVNQQRNHIGLYNKESVPALTTTTVATTTKLPVPALTTTTVATTTKLPASTPVLSSITAAPTTKLPVSTPELGTTTIATTTKLPDLQEVDLSSISSTSGATTFYHSGYRPDLAFADNPSAGWCSRSGPPQTLWKQFQLPLKAYKISFQGRRDYDGDVPSKFDVFGSHNTDCTHEESWVILATEDSGIKKTNEHIENINIPSSKIDSYVCYGLRVRDVPDRGVSKYACVSHFKFYVY